MTSYYSYIKLIESRESALAADIAASVAPFATIFARHAAGTRGATQKELLAAAARAGMDDIYVAADERDKDWRVAKRIAISRSFDIVVEAFGDEKRYYVVVSLQLPTADKSKLALAVVRSTYAFHSGRSSVDVNPFCPSYVLRALVTGLNDGYPSTDMPLDFDVAFGVFTPFGFFMPCCASSS